MNCALLEENFNPVKTGNRHKRTFEKAVMGKGGLYDRVKFGF